MKGKKLSKSSLGWKFCGERVFKKFSFHWNSLKRELFEEAFKHSLKIINLNRKSPDASKALKIWRWEAFSIYFREKHKSLYFILSKSSITKEHIQPILTSIIFPVHQFMIDNKLTFDQTLNRYDFDCFPMFIYREKNILF
jgi:hypothetical protein